MTAGEMKHTAPSKITKGPWRYIPYGGYCFFIHSDGEPFSPRVATITYTSGAHSFHEADARLIAAAPELLEAGSGILDLAGLDDFLNSPTIGSSDSFGIRKSELLKLRAANAKAKGAA